VTVHPAPYPLPLDELWADVSSGAVENVIVAVPDLQGRLQGSRLDPEHFRDSVLKQGFEACVYLLAVDVEMNTRSGYAVDAWDAGFGDMVLAPDLATLRRLPWDQGTALVLADARWQDGRPVRVAPRQVVRDQLSRLAERGLTALAGTELEFMLFTDSFQRASDADYRGLRPATRYNVDYSVAGVAEIDPVVRRIRNAMRETGMRMESARGECHPGQYEIVFRYDEALRTCDNHVVYKTGARQIAAAEGMALTFMAKYDEGEGNSCHVHLSLRSADGTPAFAAASDVDSWNLGGAAAPGTLENPRVEGPAGMSPLMAHFVAGVLACAREFALLSAPNINSYKRLAPEAFAPTAIAWGRDNRTCPVRVVGRGESLRIEYRVPGGDANPYLAVASIIAAGLHGIERELTLEAPYTGNAFVSDRPRLPETLAEALALWENSEAARDAFGVDVVAHYATAARAELAAFGASVTDWERRRGFERL
jgi:glutamine synthetase